MCQRQPNIDQLSAVGSRSDQYSVAVDKVPVKASMNQRASSPPGAGQAVDLLKMRFVGAESSQHDEIPRSSDEFQNGFKELKV